MTDNRCRILLNCEIEESRPERINKNFIQTVISILSVVVTFALLCGVASYMRSEKNSDDKNFHQPANAVYEDVVENEYNRF